MFIDKLTEHFLTEMLHKSLAGVDNLPLGEWEYVCEYSIRHGSNGLESSMFVSDQINSDRAKYYALLSIPWVHYSENSTNILDECKKLYRKFQEEICIGVIAKDSLTSILQTICQTHCDSLNHPPFETHEELILIFILNERLSGMATSEHSNLLHTAHQFLQSPVPLEIHSSCDGALTINNHRASLSANINTAISASGYEVRERQNIIRIAPKHTYSEFVFRHINESNPLPQSIDNDILLADHTDQPNITTMHLRDRSHAFEDQLCSFASIKNDTIQATYRNDAPIDSRQSVYNHMIACERRLDKLTELVEASHPFGPLAQNFCAKDSYIGQNGSLASNLTGSSSDTSDSYDSDNGDFKIFSRDSSRATNYNNDACSISPNSDKHTPITHRDDESLPAKYINIPIADHNVRDTLVECNSPNRLTPIIEDSFSDSDIDSESSRRSTYEDEAQLNHSLNEQYFMPCGLYGVLEHGEASRDDFSEYRLHRSTSTDTGTQGLFLHIDHGGNLLSNNQASIIASACALNTDPADDAYFGISDIEANVSDDIDSSATTNRSLSTNSSNSQPQGFDCSSL